MSNKVYVTVPIHRWMWERMAFLLALRGEPRASFLRRTILAGIEEELKQFPTQRVWARPRTVAYRKGSDGFYAPLCVLAGGERVWPIEVVDDLPAALHCRGLGYRCDLTEGEGQAPSVQRDVVLRIDDIANAPVRTPEPQPD